MHALLYFAFYGGGGTLSYLKRSFNTLPIFRVNILTLSAEYLTPLFGDRPRATETAQPRMVNPGIQVTLRGIVAFSAIFSGGSIVHKVFAPDLTVPDLSKPGGAAPEEGATGFVGAAAFEGARTGFAFKTGSQGLGYYTDKKR